MPSFLMYSTQSVSARKDCSSIEVMEHWRTLKSREVLRDVKDALSGKCSWDGVFFFSGPSFNINSKIESDFI